jgi:tRNA pseudouridine55 synthase
VTARTPQVRVPRRPLDGVLLLDKPAGVTSNAALQRARRAYAAEKAGHTGTLDPAASGLLPICFGEATKFAGFLLDATKSYRATIRFGATTTTGDAEGQVLAMRPVTFGRAALEAALARFRGPIAQVPPRHAALKFEGRAYYDYARAGIEIPRSAREVTIHALDLLALDPPQAIVDVCCSKGTYIRSLAEDLGEALGCGAHLAALRRTATGNFRIADSVPLDTLEAMTALERERRLLAPAVLLAGLPRLTLDGGAAAGFRNGMAAAAPGLGQGPCAVFAGSALIGVAEVGDDGFARPRRVVATRADDARNASMSA